VTEVASPSPIPDSVYHSLFVRAGSAMIIADAKTGVILDANASAGQLMNMSKEQMIGMHQSKLSPPDMAADVAKGFQSRIDQETVSVHCVLLRSDGGRVPVQIQATRMTLPDGRRIVCGIFQDVTDIQRIEDRAHERLTELEDMKRALLNVLEDVEEERNVSQALAEDLKKFKLAVESSTDQIVIEDPSATILFANQAAVRLSGFSLTEILGRKACDLWRVGLAPELLEEINRTVLTDKKSFICQLRNQKKNGDWYDVEVQILPLLDEAGVVRFCVSIEHDITRLKELDRMKTEFVSMASHQLKNPLTNVRWYVELLEETHPKKNQLEYLKEIQTGNERMIKLVEDLLNVSRIETQRNFSIEPTRGDLLAEIASVIAEQTAAAYEHQVSISLEKDGLKKLFVRFDEGKMHQLLQNLINNAVKYSYPHGTVVVSCEERDTEVICSVQDQGIGVPKHQQKHLFERFFRAQNAQKHAADGTGLGLYIAKAIAEGHGGRIWFESHEGKGTTFFFSLPLEKH